MIKGGKSKVENSTLGILVMAAGKGTRMKSGLPKVLLPILDKPMLGYLLETVSNCGPDGVAVLVGHEGEQVCDYLKAFPGVEPLWQREQLGTGHAVQAARGWWERFDHVLVLNGDLPLLSLATLRSFLGEHFEAKAACSLLSFVTEHPEGYGRVIRGPGGDGGGVTIVEHKDASPEQRLVRAVNAGCYIFEVKELSLVIDRIKNDNAQGEYYLPDAVALMSQAGLKVRGSVADEEEASGVNTQAELAAMTLRVRNALAESWMAKGVRILDPSAVWIGPDVELAPDVSLMPGVQIWGKSVVGEGSLVGPYCILRNARLGRRVCLTAHVVVEDSVLCDEAKAGPFAYIREGSLLKDRAFAGKFVELKKTTVGENSKIPHLSYMGDAVLGENVNIGAGSVTCNYDGKNKFPTTIGDRCFVGSDTMMVAPVVLGDDSATAAGSTITADVPAGALAVGRARQKNIEGWASRKHQMGK
ncbi:MAG: bifunctional UDP-N-acetylglucosamine diphosphorylase/glucosamine-1-phosphate N-acetyltransferase GlmU [Synergistaceae bacterium]|nr:bifunctional UDP-N-acetylglucosamine diphosphorylase/glucosamine-1-phosphate N-acetyltransferase GlmU [Synergistaceae bacterium]